MDRKIFCIGFHKTGTTSLANALEFLGYSVTGPNGVQRSDIAEVVRDLAHALVSHYDAFQDNPWPLLYREMDTHYPGSKFILTYRDPDSWITSQVRYFGSEETPMRQWIYGVGSPVGNEERYLEIYRRHNQEVQEYFSARPKDLLVMDLTKGDGWEKLCPFLGHPIPNSPFPHANKTDQTPPRGRLATARHRLIRLTTRWTSARQ